MVTTITLGKRIGIAFQMVGTRAPVVARETGVPVTSINALLRRGSRRSEFTEKILEVLPPTLVNHDWIRTGEGSPEPLAVAPIVKILPEIVDAFSVQFKQSTAATVDRETIERLAKKFAQDTTFVVHLALARLRDDVDAGEPILVSL